jgi:hypothetical protein
VAGVAGIDGDGGCVGAGASDPEADGDARRGLGDRFRSSVPQPAAASVATMTMDRSFTGLDLAVRYRTMPPLGDPGTAASSLVGLLPSLV